MITEIVTGTVLLALAAAIAYVSFRFRDMKIVEIEIADDGWEGDEITLTVVNTGRVPVTVRRLRITAPLGGLSTRDAKLSKWTRLARKLNLKRLAVYPRRCLVDAEVEDWMSRGHWYGEMLEKGEMIKLEPAESASRSVNRAVLDMTQKIGEKSEGVLVFPSCELVGNEAASWGNPVGFAKGTTLSDEKWYWIISME